MSCPYQRFIVLVEEVFAQQQLNLLKLFNPNTLSKLTEFAVEFITGKRGIDLAQIAIRKRGVEN